jgi:hypothetical protein
LFDNAGCLISIQRLFKVMRPEQIELWLAKLSVEADGNAGVYSRNSA